MKIVWHPLARADLAELVAHVASENPSAAYRLHENMQKQVQTLAAFPDVGRKGRVRRTRELVIAGTPYLAAYRVAENVVTVLRVLHGARRWPRRI